MPTIRKNVKNYLLFVAYAVLLLLVLVIVIFLIPDPPPGTLPIIYVIPERKAEIAWAFLTIFLCFMSYKFYRSIKCAENPRQAIWDNLKAHIVILLSISAMSYVGMAVFVTLFPTEYGRCDFFNKHLNGGVKKFQDQKLKVHLCGTGGYSSMLSHEDYEIRLQVFSEQGELLATRYFTISYGDGFSQVIEYHPDSIKYEDYADHNDDDFETTLSMPPTTLDWIRARIPLLD